jgi:hypothetical protein
METCQGLFSYWAWQTPVSVPGHGNQPLTPLHLSQGNCAEKEPSVWKAPLGSWRAYQYHTPKAEDSGIRLQPVLGNKIFSR